MKHDVNQSSREQFNYLDTLFTVGIVIVWRLLPQRINKIRIDASQSKFFVTVQRLGGFDRFS